jgi:hypothetical protein
MPHRTTSFASTLTMREPKAGAENIITFGHFNIVYDMLASEWYSFPRARLVLGNL